MSPSGSRIIVRGAVHSLLLFSSCLFLGLPPVAVLADELASDHQGEAAASPPTVVTARQVRTGYVFIDGQFLPGPYRVEQIDEGVLINGVLIKAEQFPRITPVARPGFGGSTRPGWQAEGGPWGWQGASRPGRWRQGQLQQEPSEQEGSDEQESASRLLTVHVRRPPPTFAHLQWRVVYRLEQEAALVAFSNRPLVFLEAGPQIDDLMAVFARPGALTQSLETILTDVPVEDHEHWKAWLASYTPPPELARLADERTAAKEALIEANRAEVDAVRRIDKYSYPLSLVGMLLGVVAAGHLLKSVPARDAQSASDAMQPQLRHFVIISAALVFLLSSLDLAWTLLAAQAGQMRELNPLGQGLIDDPASLMAFKLSATFVSCALLVALRRHHTAQLASWWLCLICTMLTFRWLMFNSMFMGT